MGKESKKKPLGWGLAALAQRRRDHNLAILPYIVSLLKTGMTEKEVAGRLNRERRFNSVGRPWTQAGIWRVVNCHASQDDKAIIARARAERRGDLYRAACAPVLFDWWRETLSLEAVTARANADKKLRKKGPWSRWRVWFALRQNIDPAKYKAVAKMAKAHASATREGNNKERTEQHARRMIELEQEGKTQPEISVALFDEGICCRAGTPYSGSRISRVTRQYRHVFSQATARDGTPPVKRVKTTPIANPVILLGPNDAPAVKVRGKKMPRPSPHQYACIKALEGTSRDQPIDGITARKRSKRTTFGRIFRDLRRSDDRWASVLHSDRRGYWMGDP